MLKATQPKERYLHRPKKHRNAGKGRIALTRFEQRSCDFAVINFFSTRFRMDLHKLLRKCLSCVGYGCGIKISILGCLIGREKKLFSHYRKTSV